MTNLNPSMRLKVKTDTFFLPDEFGGVYFRNNEGSFRMEGKTIAQWIEKLIPILDGTHTLADLTDDLPDTHKVTLYKIADVLYQNGFVQDVSVERTHGLPSHVAENYACQIEFINQFVDSGAYRFEVYRKTKVLAVGSGPFLTSLVAASLNSGLPKQNVLVTDSVPTNRKRIIQLVNQAKKSDTQVELNEVNRTKDCSWQDIVRPFDAILYVSETGDDEQVRVLNQVCKQEKKMFIPALFMNQAGFAGPLVHPDSSGCFESAWRRIHQTALCNNPQFHSISSTAMALLANVIVFELFKSITGVTPPTYTNQFFLLNLETLEGEWHSFQPHPLVEVEQKVTRINLSNIQPRAVKPNELLAYCETITSPQSGVFHIWDEGDLIQLPMSQCRIQVVDPLSKGPAALLPETICNGMTHEDARIESALFGIEQYATRLLTAPPVIQKVRNQFLNHDEWIGVGAGETVAQGVYRGFQKCLDHQLRKQFENDIIRVEKTELTSIEDEYCNFYLQSLTTMQPDVTIGLSSAIYGFSVVWVRTGETNHYGIGLDVTQALQNSLKKALFFAQNQSANPAGLQVSFEEQFSQNLMIKPLEHRTHAEELALSLHVLSQNHLQIDVLDLSLDPFVKEALAGAFGVILREEES